MKRYKGFKDGRLLAIVDAINGYQARTALQLTHAFCFCWSHPPAECIFQYRAEASPL